MACFPLAALSILSAAMLAGQTPPADDDLEIITAAWADPAKCDAGTARPVTIDALLDSNVENGTCVVVEGFWRGRAIFPTSRFADSDAANVGESLRSRRVGLYARPELLTTAPARATRYRMTGVVGRCEIQWPGADMVMGYCHYTGGPILLVASAVPAPD